MISWPAILGSQVIRAVASGAPVSLRVTGKVIVKRFPATGRSGVALGNGVADAFTDVAYRCVGGPTVG